MAASIVLAGCSKTEVTEETPNIETAYSEESSWIQITGPETEAEPVIEPIASYEFNPHLYSTTIGDVIPDDYYESFYNLVDALRAGKNTFECSSQEAYNWATDDATLNNLFPAACMKITGISSDGTVPFENGTGRIYYKMPVEEFVAREAKYEEDIEEVLNTWLEYDDDDFEKCVKLYNYMESTYLYGEVDAASTGDGADYKAFDIQQGVCDHLASIYAYLLMQAGVEALNIGIFEPDMCHAWTYVVINGQGYHVDPTWSLKSSLRTDDLYLTYFMMSDDLRISTGCLLNDITAPLLPGFWENKYDKKFFRATDKSYEFPGLSVFKELDEDNKILYYYDFDGNLNEMSYA